MICNSVGMAKSHQLQSCRIGYLTERLSSKARFANHFGDCHPNFLESNHTSLIRCLSHQANECGRKLYSIHGDPAIRLLHTSSLKLQVMKHFLSLATLLIGSIANASIINVVGSGNILTAGSGVGYTADFFGDPSLIIHGWDELQNFTLPSNLAVDITTTGSFASGASVTPGIIPAGTVVNSHAFYFDPAGGGSTSAGF